MERLVFIDLETKRSLQEVGGRDRVSALGLSVAVTFDSLSGEYRAYTERDVEALVEELKGADLVVGFNLKRFDYLVLQPYTPHALSELPTLDMLDEIYRVLGYRMGLDALALGTLGTGKSGHGMEAIRWFQEGRLDLVIEYCKHDVDLTRQLYQHGKEKGYLLFWDEGLQLSRRVVVDW